MGEAWNLSPAQTCSGPNMSRSRSRCGPATEIRRRTDTVLNVAHIARLAPLLGRRVTCLRIEGGVHDLMLPAKPVRKHVYDELGRWLGAYLSGQVRDRLL
jgi:hypothetical protein